MCLISKNPELKFATEDIVCWKVLYYTPRSGYETPFQHRKVSISVVCGSEPFMANEDVVVGLRADGDFDYSEGVIHSYARDYNARYWLSLSDNYHLFECRIPKGTLFAKGIDTNGDLGFASKEIVFVRKEEK